MQRLLLVKVVQIQPFLHGFHTVVWLDASQTVMLADKMINIRMISFSMANIKSLFILYIVSIHSLIKESAYMCLNFMYSICINRYQPLFVHITKSMSKLLSVRRMPSLLSGTNLF